MVGADWQSPSPGRGWAEGDELLEHALSNAANTAPQTRTLPALPTAHPPVVPAETVPRPAPVAAAPCARYESL